MDGHAKNFSLFIRPQGKFNLTPLYEVISAYPMIASKQWQAQNIKMAMALESKNKHYNWHNIQRRHFIETAYRSNFSKKLAEQLFEEVMDSIEDVIAQVSDQIPPGFPDKITDAVFSGMKRFKKRIS